MIDTMELRVVDQTKDAGGTATVAANTKTPAASVLGAACHEFKIPLDTRLGKQRFSIDTPQIEEPESQSES